MPQAALTGPVLRGDVGLVTQHLDALEKEAPEILALYRALMREALVLAARDGLDADKISLLSEILKDRDE